MPTNKLWIEHTERAAWDSVEALRERLLKAEERLQALAPNIDRLPQLLDLLGQAKQKYAAQVTGYDEVVSELLSRLDTLQAELAVAKTPEPTVVSFGAPVSRPRMDSEDLDEHDVDGAEDDADIGDFTQTMRRRHEAGGLELPRDLNRLLELAEQKLDDLAELDGAALREAALDLAILSARIHEVSRSKA